MEKTNEVKKRWGWLLGVVIVVLVVGGFLFVKYAKTSPSTEEKTETLKKEATSGGGGGAVDSQGRLILPYDQAPVIRRCGNGVCDSEELLSDGRSYCDKDCIPTCGNNICEIPESWANCGDCPQPQR